MKSIRRDGPQISRFTRRFKRFKRWLQAAQGFIKISSLFKHVGIFFFCGPQANADVLSGLAVGFDDLDLFKTRDLAELGCEVGLGDAAEEVEVAVGLTPASQVKPGNGASDTAIVVGD